ncbi:MAG: beta-galactosidase, partial [Planctomycetes bacterium]|nr:beta-galactosidase [Planctomycetota bacterium]
SAIGKIKPRPSAAIAASPLGVGFETLDRRHFDPAKTYPFMAQLGVKWARCQTGWGRTETKKGEFDFKWLDDIVDSLRRIGVQPWFNLGYGNQLYTPDAPDEAAVGWAPVFTDEAKAAWLRYTARIAEHFADRVAVWEIWNEPNITNFWKPSKPSAADYAALVKATVPEIRKRIPKAVIVGAALAGTPADFLKGCMEAGLGDVVDKISYHPYRAVPEAGYEKDIRALRDVIAKHKPGLALWQGENGAPSVKGGAGALANAEWNEERQAKWLLRRILSDLRLGIELTSYFLIVDLVGYRGSTNYKGLLRGTDYTPKPSYFVYQHTCALFDAETKRTDLAVRAEDAEAEKIVTAVFARQGRPVYLYWYPADLMKDWTVRKVGLRAAAGPDLRLEKPVLADPLTGKVYALAAPKKDGDAYVFTGLPLADYPLLVTDAAVVGA